MTRALLLSPLIVTLGCGTGVVTVQDPQELPPARPEAPSNCTSQLTVVGPAEQTVMAGTQLELPVLLRDPCKGPVAGADITFTLGATTDSRLQATATTDGAGLARALFTAGQTAAVLEVNARAPDLAPARFVVTVSMAPPVVPPVDACANHCGNGRQDCAETGMDCGGSCAACPVAMRDDAAVVSVTAPASLVCSAASQATVTLRNTGTTTWTSAGGYRLEFVGGGSAPFLPAGATPRVEVPGAVAPGATAVFTLTLAAPAIPMSYDARFQMVQGAAFGAIASARVTVTPGCAVTTGCRFPQQVPEPDFTHHATTSGSVASTVNSVMQQLSGCPVGSDCPIGATYPTAQSWFDAVNVALRARGLCAGQHEEGHTDEIAVSDSGCTGLWYGFHVFNYGGSKVVWAPGAQRGSWSITPGLCPP